MRRTQAVRSKRHAAAALAALVSLTAAGCTISVFEDAEDDAHVEDGHDGDDHDEASGAEEDHSHDEGSDGEEEHSHDEGSDGEGSIDHHGNRIFDENERVYEQFVQDGVSVEFTVENFIGVGGRGGEAAPRLAEGEHATLQFHVTDAATGAPLGGLRPAVWLDSADARDDCTTSIEGYLSGTLDRRPLIDLNSYFVLGMNRENSISVIDPMVDVGGMTNLFSLVLLQGTPQDWAMSAQASRLFVTMPDIGRIAVVDLDAFLAEESLEVPGVPVRIAIEPGGARAWATLGDAGGIAVIDVTTLDVGVVETDGPTHDLAFSPDGATAIVGTRDGVLFVDVDRRTQTGHMRLPGEPVASAISTANGHAYVAQPDPGLVSVVDVDGAREIARLQTDPGLTDIGVSVDGRWVMAASASAETAYLIETTTNRITHVFPVPGEPDQIVFSETAAYLHNGAAPSITAVPLAEIDPEGDLSVLTVPVGSTPPGSADTTAMADAIMATPDGRALLIADPMDDTVHFYTEGSEAALGGFQGHTLQPRAVQIVDRSLKEPAEGVYTASFRIPEGGDLNVAFLLDDPSITHCFSFSTHTAEGGLDDVDAVGAKVELTGQQPLAVGRANELEFALRDAVTGEPIDGLADVVVKLIDTGGRDTIQSIASAQRGGGYSATVTPSDTGTYTVLVAVPSLGLTFQGIPPVSVRVAAP